MNFKCPTCGCNELEEVVTGVRVVTAIESVAKEGYVYYHEDPERHGGESTYYQCSNCGEELRWDHDSVVSSGEELFDWLTENNMIEVPTE